MPGSQQVWLIDGDTVPDWVREFNRTHLAGAATHVMFHAAGSLDGSSAGVQHHHLHDLEIPSGQCAKAR